MVLLFLIMGVAGIALYTITLKKLYDKKSDWWMISLCFSLCMISAGYMIEGKIIQKENPGEIHSNSFIVKSEVRLKITNGKEVSRDTVYIFTPKKK
jgi:hypothetical protein